jgi:hypothetical protein
MSLKYSGFRLANDNESKHFSQVYINIEIAFWPLGTKDCKLICFRAHENPDPKRGSIDPQQR